MNNWMDCVLDKIGIGILIIDRQKKIIVWNDWLVRYTHLSKEDVVNRGVAQVIQCFEKKIYDDMLNAALFQGQGRFCSGSLHPPFVLAAKEDMSRVRQNLMIDPVTIENEVFAVIQIIDVTAYHTRVSHLITKMKTLEIVQDEMKEAQQLNRQLALHDSLTGLPNRTLLMERLAWGVENAERSGEMVGVMFIDLDGFKEVNDTFGHESGDSMLQAVAARLKSSIRKNDTVARYGGDEFVVILMQLKSMSDAHIIATKILETFDAPFPVNSNSFRLSVSIGISFYPNDTKDVQCLIKYADTAMYKVKKSGKNNYGFYQEL